MERNAQLVKLTRRHFTSAVIFYSELFLAANDVFSRNSRYRGTILRQSGNAKILMNQ